MFGPDYVLFSSSREELGRVLLRDVGLNCRTKAQNEFRWGWMLGLGLTRAGFFSVTPRESVGLGPSA